VKNKLALITGATAGIGQALARHLAERGCHLILTGRREKVLKNFAAELSKSHGIEVECLNFDIRDRSALERALNPLHNRLKNLDFLINNAGLAAGVDKMQVARPEDWDTMIDTNIKGLLYITRYCLQHLIENKGHIVNLGSVAGRWTYPGGGVYSATKFATRALTEGLRFDLMGTGVRVTNIEPGMVETEFSLVRLGDADKAKAVYQGMTPLNANDIAETIVWCLQRPAHVNIQELVIYPTDQAGVGPVYTVRK
jgi:NADP-dependent 3-hydroxy acid dehydrogenase YdfG